MILVIILIFFSFVIPCHADIIDTTRIVTWQGNVGTTNIIPSTGAVVNCVTSYSVPTNGTSNCATQINNCLAGISSGQVAYLPAGTYQIQSSIYIPSNKVLRGAGIGTTTIKGKTAWSGWGMVGFNSNSPSFGTSVNISGSPAKGDTTINTSSAHGLTTGDYVIIDILENPTGDPPVTITGTESGGCTFCGRTSGRPLGQFSRVASTPTGTSFTIDIPLYWTYSSSLTPQVTKILNPIVNAGLESLTLDNSVVKDEQAGLFWAAAQSWFYNVEIYYSQRIAIALIGYRNTIRGCKIYETSLPLGSNSGYGIWAQFTASANLIEDNIIYNLSNPIIVNGGFSGNVIAYNFLHGHDGNTGRQNGAFSSHGAHPVMNLIEGNYMVGAVGMDFYWGSSSHYTYYRNRIQLQTPLSSYASYPWNLWMQTKNHYMNYVGNLLWTSGLAGTYEDDDDPAGSTLYSVNSDNVSTLYRHGNYDYINNAQQWDAGNADHTLTNSLYLASSPSSTWWCSETTYPPVNPATPSVSDIPAKRRYDSATCTLGASLPSSFSGTTIQGGKVN